MVVNTYSPRSLVVVLRLMLVRSFVSVTSTPGMTPPESLTDPRRPPWNPWPKTVPEVTTASNAPSMSGRNFIVFLRGVDRDQPRSGLLPRSQNSLGNWLRGDSRGERTGFQQLFAAEPTRIDAPVAGSI